MWVNHEEETRKVWELALSSPWQGKCKRGKVDAWGKDSLVMVAAMAMAAPRHWMIVELLGFENYVQAENTKHSALS